MEKDSKLSNVEGLKNQSLNTHSGTLFLLVLTFTEELWPITWEPKSGYKVKRSFKFESQHRFVIVKKVVEKFKFNKQKKRDCRSNKPGKWGHTVQKLAYSRQDALKCLVTTFTNWSLLWVWTILVKPATETIEADTRAARKHQVLCSCTPRIFVLY